MSAYDTDPAYNPEPLDETCEWARGGRPDWDFEDEEEDEAEDDA